MVRESKFVSTDGRRVRVGVVGGGQLAQMMLQAAIPLGVDVRVFAHAPGEGAAAASCDVVVGEWHDRAALVEFAHGCDLVTFDHELVPADVLGVLEEAGVLLRPSAAAMALASDKVAQRQLAERVGIPTTPAAVVTTEEELRAAVTGVGFPSVLKATRGGYDGRGVRWVRGPSDLDHADGLRIPSERDPMVVEPSLAIDAELAVVVARGADGSAVSYPVVGTEQVDGICVTVTAPATAPDELAAQARSGALAIAESLGYVGVLAVEYFVVDGELRFNEMAPRPHNSGHYTIDACVTSQFENHLRAVLGWPLGDPSMKTPAAVMANVIAGTSDPVPIARVPVPEGARVHLYSKAGRSGRKIGHVTACGSDPVALRRTATAVAARLAGPPVGSTGRVGSAVGA